MYTYIYIYTHIFVLHSIPWLATGPVPSSWTRAPAPSCSRGSSAKRSTAANAPRCSGTRPPSASVSGESWGCPLKNGGNGRKIVLKCGIWMEMVGGFQKWGSPRLGLCLFHGKSQSKMDDDWVYSPILGNLHVFCDRRMPIIMGKIGKTHGWGFPSFG